jgi:SAM-dependent methyltransferase
MMLGTGDRFLYLECGRCGALQIRDIPADLSRYYAPPYYSFEAPQRAAPVRRWLKRRLARHVLGRFDPLGAVLARARGVTPDLEWVRTAGLGPDAAILDVGAGAGQVLVSLRDTGFRRLLGVEPFLADDLDHGDGARVLAAGLEAVEERFDLVMFHHSFEHVPDPAATLAAARDRLAPGGRILIRTPLAAASWREYGVDWVELDGPRHLHVHTETSLRELASRTGLEVVAVRYDTDGFELWGSEQYRSGIPLADPRSHSVGGAGFVFSPAELAAFEARAAELKRRGDAGRAAFYLAAGSG